MKNTSSKELTKTLQDNGAKVRFYYERYPIARFDEKEVRLFVKLYGFEQPVRNDDLLVVGRNLLSNSEIKEQRLQPYENGGRVTVRILTKSGEEIEAVSDCSIVDVFNKETGRRIALGRAIKKLSTEAPIQEQ